jgi:membrane associated rhomboid family serine protease
MRMFLYFILVNLLYLSFEIFRRGRGFYLYAFQISFFSAVPAWLLFGGSSLSGGDVAFSFLIMAMIVIVPHALASAERRALFSRDPATFSRISLFKFMAIPTADNYFQFIASRVLVRRGVRALIALVHENSDRIVAWKSIYVLRSLVVQTLLKNWSESESDTVSDPDSCSEQSATPASRAIDFLQSTLDYAPMGPTDFLLLTRCHLENGQYSEAAAVFEMLSSIVSGETLPEGWSRQEARSCIPVGLMLAFSWAGHPQGIIDMAGNSAFGLSGFPREQIYYWQALAWAFRGNSARTAELMEKVKKTIGRKFFPSSVEQLEHRIHKAIYRETPPMDSAILAGFAGSASMALGIENGDESQNDAAGNEQNEAPEGTYSGAPVSLGILTFCSALFAIVYFYGARVGAGDYLELDTLIRFGANVGFLVKLGEWHRFLTCVFLHGNLTHLLMNMLFLHMFAPSIERSLGSMGFTAVFVFSGVGGSVLNYYMGGEISVGASGALMGLLGFALLARIGHPGLLESKSGFSDQDGPSALRPLIFSLVAIVAIGSLEKSIDNFGHLGGLLGGVLTGIVLVGLRGGPGISTVRRIKMGAILGAVGIISLLLSAVAGVNAFWNGGYPRLFPELTMREVATGIRVPLPANWEEIKSEKGLWSDRIRAFFRLMPYIVRSEDAERFWGELEAQNRQYLESGKGMRFLSMKSSVEEHSGRQIYNSTWVISTASGETMCSSDYLVTGTEPAPMIHFQLLGTTVEPAYEKLFRTIALGAQIDMKRASVKSVSVDSDPNN